MVKSFLVSSLILFCATIVEASILSNISFLLIVPDLVLICSLYFSFLKITNTVIFIQKNTDISRLCYNSVKPILGGLCTPCAVVPVLVVVHCRWQL